jgi:putative transposase
MAEMKDRRDELTGDFKTKIVQEAIKGHRTVSEIASQHGAHPHQITEWKKQVLEGVPEILWDKRSKCSEDRKELVPQLYQQIGQLKVEVENPSVVRQCELMGLSRSNWYRKPREAQSADLEPIHRIDEQCTRTPFYGIGRMTASLHQHGHCVNHKRVQRLTRFMGLEVIYSKPGLSKTDEQHKMLTLFLDSS